MSFKPGKKHTRSPDEEVPLPGELDCRAYGRRAARVAVSILRDRPRRARLRVDDMVALNPDFAAHVMWLLDHPPAKE